MAEVMDLWFARSAPAGAQLVTWHRSLEYDTAGRAELRRSSEPNGALFVPAFHRLRAGLEEAVPGVDLVRFGRMERIAAIACTAAQVREDLPARSFGDQLARPREGRSKPGVSLLRFRRLIEADQPTELTRQLRRVVTLLDGRVDVVALADVIYRWNAGRTRQALALDYYRVAASDADMPIRTTKPAKGVRD